MYRLREGERTAGEAALVRAMAREFLSLRAAAAYIGVPKRLFEESAPMYGAKPLVVMGVPMYRVADLEEMLRRLWSAREFKPQVTQQQIQQSVQLTNALISRLMQGSKQ